MKGELAIGRVTRAGRTELLRVSLSTMLGHGLVTGSTGSGKTGFLLGLLSSLTAHHAGVGRVLLDPKGETAKEWRDHFLPALAEHHNGIDPRTMLCIEPFGSAVVPLNPLWPIPTLAPEVQANIVVELFESMVDGMGQRMRGVLGWLTRAVLATRQGSLLDVHRLLVDETFCHALAQRLPDEELREYLTQTFVREPAASKDAVRARIEWLLGLPAVRGMLTARGCIEGRALIETPLVVVDLSGAPMGFAGASRFIGGFLFSLLGAAIFDRKVGEHMRPVLLVLDEFPELMRARGVGDEMERLLSQARFKKVGIWSAAQTLAQVGDASTLLLRSMLTNTAVRVAFRPDKADVSDLVPLLTHGNRIDPALPDRVLSRAEEGERQMQRLAKLPPRYALFADRIAGRAQVIRTLDLPYEQARERARALAPELRRCFARGFAARELAELLASPARIELLAASPSGRAPRGGGPAKRPKAKLVLP